MLGKFFKSKQPANGLSEMTMQDLPRVIEIIEETDEDDAQEAETSMISSRCAGMYVLRDAGEIIGVIGSYNDDSVDDIAWLSWTYLTESKQGQGFGRFMVEAMLEKLDAAQVRKIFIASSDYQEDGEAIYAEAHSFYKAMGAEIALIIPGFHSADESMIIFELLNQRIEKTPAERPPAPEGVLFEQPEIAPESDDAAVMNWVIEDTGVSGLSIAKELAKGAEARVVFTALPADVSDFAETELESHGFTRVGSLTDYYDVGFDQIWWQLNV